MSQSTTAGVAPRVSAWCGAVRHGAAAAILLSLAVTAVHASAPRSDTASYVAYADVVQVSPRYGWHEVSEPVRQCVDVARSERGRYPAPGYRVERRYHDDYRRPRDGSETAAGLVGGLIGGLIGNQFGGGNGRTALTVAGAALGASIASSHVRRSHGWDRAERYDGYYRSEPTVRRCTDSVRTRQVRGVDGYDVTYRYQGQTFHKWVDEHPGETVRIEVAVAPADDLGTR